MKNIIEKIKEKPIVLIGIVAVIAMALVLAHTAI